MQQNYGDFRIYGYPCYIWLNNKKKDIMNKAVNNKTKEQWMNWLKWFKNHRYELSKEEGLALRDAIITFYCVAVEFFYNTLEPMNKGFVYKIEKTYHVTISDMDIATWVYREIYNEGKWNRLTVYAGNCSLFSWISLAASQIIFEELEALHIIKKDSKPSIKITSLTLRSMKKKEEVEAVINLVAYPIMNSLLKYLYVERLSETDIMKTMSMTPELYKKTKKVAETILKESLINEGMMLWHREDGKIVDLVKMALSNVSNTINTLNSEDVLLAALNLTQSEEDYPEVKDALEEFYPGRPWREQWTSFIMERYKEMGWSVEDETVFVERFYHNNSPVILAKTLGRARSWVDNKYSRELKALAEYIKVWWERFRE